MFQIIRCRALQEKQWGVFPGEKNCCYALVAVVYNCILHHELFWSSFLKGRRVCAF